MKFSPQAMYFRPKKWKKWKFYPSIFLIRFYYNLANFQLHSLSRAKALGKNVKWQLKRMYWKIGDFRHTRPYSNADISESVHRFVLAFCTRLQHKRHTKVNFSFLPKNLVFAILAQKRQKMAILAQKRSFWQFSPNLLIEFH